MKVRELYSAMKAAQMLGISLNRLDQYRQQGVTTPVNVATRWIYGEDDIVSVMNAEKRRAQGKPLRKSLQP